MIMAKRNCERKKMFILSFLSVTTKTLWWFELQNHSNLEKNCF